MFERWRNDQSGATAIEYALIAGLVSIAIVGGLSLFVSGTGSFYGKIQVAFDTYLGSS